MKLFLNPNQIKFKSNSSNLTYPLSNLTILALLGITKCPRQKHLEIALDSKLSSNTHVAQKIMKCNELVVLIKRLSINLQVMLY